MLNIQTVPKVLISVQLIHNKQTGINMQTGSYNEFKFIKKTEDSSKLQEYHRYLKSKIVDYYKSHKLSDVDLKCILPKPNLVVQTTEEVCKYLQIVI